MPVVLSRVAVQTAQRYYHQPRRSFLGAPAAVLPSLWDRLTSLLRRRPEHHHLEQAHESVCASHHGRRDHHHHAQMLGVGIPLFGVVLAAVAWVRKHRDLRDFR